MLVSASVRWRSPSYCCTYWRPLVLFLPHNSGAHVCYFCINPLNLLKIEHPLLSVNACHFTILSPIFFEWIGLSLTSKWVRLWGLPCFLSLSVFSLSNILSTICKFISIKLWILLHHRLKYWVTLVLVWSQRKCIRNRLSGDFLLSPSSWSLYFGSSNAS